MITTYNYDYSRGSIETTEFKKTCIHCESIHLFKISISDYNDIFYKARFMQDIFPELSLHQRELMISGTCQPCWDEIFGDSDE